MADKKIYRASTFAPVNIAVIKYVTIPPIHYPAVSPSTQSFNASEVNVNASQC